MHNSLYLAGPSEYDCACTVAAMSTFSIPPPFLRYTGPRLWASPVPVLSFLRHGNVVTFGAVSYGIIPFKIVPFVSFGSLRPNQQFFSYDGMSR